MGVAITDTKADHDVIQKRDVVQLGASVDKILRRIELKLIFARLDIVVFKKGGVRTPIFVGERARDWDKAITCLAKQRDFYPFPGRAICRV